MAIPDFQKIMLPFLKFLGDRQEHSIGETVDSLADQFDLSDKERGELLPSGQQTIFRNRVGWARTHLGKAVLLESTRRGYFKITKRGLTVLKGNPPDINIKFLDQFEEFRKFRTHKKEDTDKHKEAQEQQDKTPEEALEFAYQNLRNGCCGQVKTDTLF
jgi:restriction system protein